MNRVIFLDRDGVINQYPGDTGYVKSPKEFSFIAGSVEGIKKLKKSGFKIFIISNQAGVGKGIYAKKDLDSITKKMRAVMRKQGADIDGVYYCTHHPQDNCLCRKPKTGLLEEAAGTLKGPLDVSFFIGDSFKDMEAAKKFGVTSVLVFSGRENISRRGAWPFEPDYIFDNLLIAAQFISARYGK